MHWNSLLFSSLSLCTQPQHSAMGSKGRPITIALVLADTAQREVSRQSCLQSVQHAVRFIWYSYTLTQSPLKVFCCVIVICARPVPIAPPVRGRAKRRGTEDMADLSAFITVHICVAKSNGFCPLLTPLRHAHCPTNNGVEHLYLLLPLSSRQVPLQGFSLFGPNLATHAHEWRVDFDSLQVKPRHGGGDQQGRQRPISALPQPRSKDRSTLLCGDRHHCRRAPRHRHAQPRGTRTAAELEVG